jgi:hypothetical protein
VCLAGVLCDGCCLTAFIHRTVAWCACHAAHRMGCVQLCTDVVHGDVEQGSIYELSEANLVKVGPVGSGGLYGILYCMVDCPGVHGLQHTRCAVCICAQMWHMLMLLEAKSVKAGAPQKNQVAWRQWCRTGCVHMWRMATLSRAASTSCQRQS